MHYRQALKLEVGTVQNIWNYATKSYNKVMHQHDIQCYVLFDGRAPGEHTLEDYIEEISRGTDQPIRQLDVATPEGEHIRTMYSLAANQLPAILLVRHGSLMHHWFSPYLPPARDIAHYLR